MKFVCIEYVTKDDFFSVELFFFCCFVLTFSMGLFPVLLCKAQIAIKYEKYAESRYCKGFEKPGCHTYPEICRKDKGGEVEIGFQKKEFGEFTPAF